MAQHSKNFTGDRNKVVAFTYDKGYTTYRLDEFDNPNDFFSILDNMEMEVNVYLFTSYDELDRFLD